jgi:hypothetical protein
VRLGDGLPTPDHPLQLADEALTAPLHAGATACR